MPATPQKIPPSLPSPASENLRRLAALFPAIIKDGEVDFTALKEELGIFEETSKEHYELTWAGKQQAKRIAAEPVTGRTLKYVPEDSKNAEATENLYIEGDNLEVLKLLQNGYMGRIKMIYIDPPYNTGNDFVYRDSFAVSEQEMAIAEGNAVKTPLGGGQFRVEKLATNPKTSARYHANWLSMMYPRLRLAKNLLSDDGVIFISIDDNEVGNLREVCDEIFGEENFRNTIFTRRYDKNLNLQFTEQGLSKMNTGLEYILIYSKSQSTKYNPVFRESSDERSSTGYWKGFWNDADRPTMRYDIFGFTPDSGQWKWKRELAEEAVLNYVEYCDDYQQSMTLEEYWDSTGRSKKFIRHNSSGKGKNQGVEHWVPPASGILRTTNWSDLLASKSTGVDVPFDNPKNTDVIVELIRFSNSNNNGLILDFFSGSATTGHAVMQLNSEDGGNRRFIMVQYPEQLDDTEKRTKENKDAIDFCDSLGVPRNICEIGKERIRRAGDKIKAEHREAKLDTGFKVFRVDNTNIRWIAAETGQTSLEDALLASGKDLRDFVPGTNDLDIVYEILLRQYDLELTTKIQLLPEIGPRTYSIADAIIICLEETVSEEIITKIAATEPIPHKIILRDSAFADNITLKENAMLRLDALMQKHRVGGRHPYTVEFL